MKRHLSSLLFGCVGLCAGFTLCYVCLVLPQRIASPSPQWIAVPVHGRDALEWRPYVIQPMIPPKVIGKY